MSLVGDASVNHLLTQRLEERSLSLSRERQRGRGAREDLRWAASLRSTRIRTYRHARAPWLGAVCTWAFHPRAATPPASKAAVAEIAYSGRRWPMSVAKVYGVDRLRCLLVIACILGQVVIQGSGASPAAAFSAIAQGHGFDTCAAPTSATMDAWWPGTPFFNVGIYIGGANRGCAQPNLTQAWITHQQATGWGLLPIWVGAQMGNPSCTNKHVWNTNISTNTTTAYNQGYAEAQAAHTAAVNLGFALADMPII